MSPLSAGLIDRAIIESGSCAVIRTPLHDTPGGEQSAEAFGAIVTERLGCDGAADVPACLRGKTVDELIAASPSAGGAALLSRNDRFNPNADGYAIPELPLDAMLGNRFGGVPIIAGVTRDEAQLFTITLRIPDDAAYAALVEGLLPGFSDEVLAAYPASAHGGDPKAAFTTFFTDLAFVCPNRLLLRAAAARATDPAPVYGYYFTRENPGLASLGLGAAHASEIPYVFGTFAAPFRRSETDDRLSSAVRGYWTSFASDGMPRGMVAWPAFARPDETQLELGDTVRTIDGVRVAECDRIAGWVGIATM
jgi:para-nitrobenzyl esterase